ncbi:hypothetical protein ACOMHN_020619 [Nucella lapillus]
MGQTSSTVNQNSKEAQYVKDTVAANPVVVFSKSTCPFCRTAKSILGELGAEVKVIELDKVKDGSLLQDVLGHMTSARTVPRVFINGQCIGGCSELKLLHHSGKLQHML